jgi:2,3-bisphosphoglycerate-independent phosphoglycerate mutase
MSKKAFLMILDGWGYGSGDKSDVIASTPTPRWDELLAKYPNSRLMAAGEDVGLPAGQMGNSEVGHLNIGAGRVLYQDLVKINKACEDNSIKENPEIVAAYEYAKNNGKKLHLLGLMSDGGVHSSMDHLFKLTEIAKEYGLDETYVHCFMDGRDTDPRSGKGFIEKLDKHLKATTGHIGSIVGRFYAMDRDQRWERVKTAYDVLVNGVGEHTTDAVAAMQASYDNDVTDEFIKPLVCSEKAKIEEGDAVIFFNYRNDRPKELTTVLTQKDMPDEGMKTLPLYFCTMTPYDSSFKGLHILFDKDNVLETLGEVVSKAGKKQLRIAETEKFAHVTFFFSGGRESEFEGEDRILVKSPKVATYDLQPEMSAYEVKDKVVAALNEDKYDFIALNFANGDMVGHTGIYEAIQKAIIAVDDCLGASVDAAIANDYEVIIIADHGNCDMAVNADGSANTAHSLNPVPFVYITKNGDAKVEDGKLADVAPSILKIMGLEQPEVMGGKNLIK